MSGHNVGIGTLIPTATLHVNGNIIADEPTDTNHVATKGYVDNSLSLNSGVEVIDGVACTNSANGWGVSCVSYCPAGYLAIGAQCKNTFSSWGATIQTFERISTNGWHCALHRIKNSGGMSIWNRAICLKT